MLLARTAYRLWRDSRFQTLCSAAPTWGTQLRGWEPIQLVGRRLPIGGSAALGHLSGFPPSLGFPNSRRISGVVARATRHHGDQDTARERPKRACLGQTRTRWCRLSGWSDSHRPRWPGGKDRSRSHLVFDGKGLPVVAWIRGVSESPWRLLDFEAERVEWRLTWLGCLSSPQQPKWLLGYRWLFSEHAEDQMNLGSRRFAEPCIGAPPNLRWLNHFHLKEEGKSWDQGIAPRADRCQEDRGSG